MISNNNEFYQNSMINARKDNDEWKNAAGTCSANLIEKSITENGDYYASADGVDGYSSVTVNVPSSSSPFTVTITANKSFTEFTPDKTYQETITAIKANKKVIINMVIDGESESAVYDTVYYVTNPVSSSDDIYAISYAGASYTDTGIPRALMGFIWTDEGIDPNTMVQYSLLT